MSKLFKDHTGEVFGRLTALKYVGGRRWQCQCTCGKKTIVFTQGLTLGGSRSCGCLKIEKARFLNRKHGESKTKFYRIFKELKQRCRNKNSPGYKNYGGRGIKCEWASYEEFKNSMLESYSEHRKKYGDDTSLDRIDNDGPYSKANCRWATWNEQSRNTSKNRKVTFNGETMILKDWAKKYGIGYSTLLARVDRLGWSFEKALTQEVELHVKNK